jgi:hypothetical protein
MIIQDFKDTFGNDVICVHEFLRAGKRWAPVFCETLIRDRLILEGKRSVETTNKQAVDQQSVDDLIQLLTEFKASEPPQSSPKVEL